MSTIRPVLCSLGQPVLTLLKELGARLVAYTDNVLVLAEMAERARDHMDGLIYLLKNLGFLVHPEKTVREPTQEIEFLGMIVNLRMRTAPTGLEIEKKEWRQQRSEVN